MPHNASAPFPRPEAYRGNFRYERNQFLGSEQEQRRKALQEVIHVRIDQNPFVYSVRPKDMMRMAGFQAVAIRRSSE